MMKFIRNTLTAAALALALSACGEPTQQVCATYIEGIYGNDPAKVMSTLNTNGAAPDKVREAHGKLKAILDEGQKEIAKRGGMDSYKIVDEKRAGNESLVTVKVKFKDGSVDEHQVALIKVDGKWYVTNM